MAHDSRAEQFRMVSRKLVCPLHVAGGHRLDHGPVMTLQLVMNKVVA